MVQLERGRRADYISKRALHSYSHRPEINPFSGQVVCGTCGRVFVRKGWKTGGEYRKVWQCQERYKVKGKQGCTNRHIDEDVLMEAFELAWKELIDKRGELKNKWETEAEFGNSLGIQTDYNIKKMVNCKINVYTIDSIRGT